MSSSHDMALNSPGIPDSEDSISRALVSARMSAAPLAAFPGAMPDTMASAYTIQSASIERWPDSVAGWKVGMLPAPAQEQYSTERLAGPIFRSQIHESGAGSRTTMPIFVGGFAAIEAEFIFRLGQAVEPVERDWSDEELSATIAGLYVGAEIASSPMAEINNLGPTVIAADFGNNAGLLVGPEIPEWQSKAPETLPAKVTIDGDVVGEASAAAIPGGPIGALRFLYSLSAERGVVLPAGTLVSTGASTGIHDVESDSLSRVDFGEYGWFDVTFVPMTGHQ